MKRTTLINAMIIISAVVINVFMHSCKKKDIHYDPLELQVYCPKLTLHNGLFYRINTRERSIELEFSQPIDAPTVDGNLRFSDPAGSLDTAITLVSTGQKILLLFRSGFGMKEGWSYRITLGTGIRSTSGNTFKSARTLEFRTSSLFTGSGSMGQNAILFISDVHLGEERAVTEHYCRFSKNRDALVAMLDDVITGHQVRQVVILGDLFDGWAVPYRSTPFDTTADVNDAREYFMSVANAPLNLPVIDALKTIAVSRTMQLIYIPGNHDMLLTKPVLEEIIPGIVWRGDIPGLGSFAPLDEIIMEHGHRYDFFNCPQPLVYPGHILPPGFFITRLDAQGMKEHPGSFLKNSNSTSASLKFLLAWTMAFEYVCAQYAITVYPDSANILMEGMDGYTSPCSFNGIRDMYAASIEEQWPSTQALNEVPVQMPVEMAILNGATDLYLTASYEYFSDMAPKKYKIVVFGHTHNPKLKFYPSGSNKQGIYANTGSWLNAELSSHPVRTYLMIWPAQWTGSDQDIVALFQFNPDTINQYPNRGYVPTLLSEESIPISN